MAVYTSKERQALLDEVAKNGRPDKFTPERRHAILTSISKRIPYELAAQANGINEATLYRWLETGSEDLEAGIDTEYAKFCEDLKFVEQEKIVKHLENISKSPERWQAQAWILERRWWKYFSPNAAIIEFNKKLERMENSEKKDKLNAEVKELDCGRD